MIIRLARKERKSQGASPAALRVCEIFAGIQGESTFAGLPCVFVRLTGCNLRCVYCDTLYAYDEGTAMTSETIIASVLSHGIGLVEITGGEPLLQEGVFALARGILDKGLTVLVETNGSISIRPLDPRAVVIMDVKCPSSGMTDRMDLTNLDHLRLTDEVKFVLSGRQDYEWAKAFIRSHMLARRCRILFSPVHGELPPVELAAWIIGDRLPVRLNLQIHKYMYHPDARGV